MSNSKQNEAVGPSKKEMYLQCIKGSPVLRLKARCYPNDLCTSSDEFELKFPELSRVEPSWGI